MTVALAEKPRKLKPAPAAEPEPSPAGYYLDDEGLPAHDDRFELNDPDLALIGPDPREMEADSMAEMVWTPQAYELADRVGLFRGLKTELFEGKVYVMAGMSRDHLVGAQKGSLALRRAFGLGEHGFYVWDGLPFGDKPTDKAPDFFVVRGNVIGIPAPGDVVLVVEVSRATLKEDRTLKLRHYAGQGYAEYWIVNLLDRLLEVHRDPKRKADGTPGYATRLTFGPDREVSPLAKPDAAIKVADLLP